MNDDFRDCLVLVGADCFVYPVDIQNCVKQEDNDTRWDSDASGKSARAKGSVSVASDVNG